MRSRRFACCWLFAVLAAATGVAAASLPTPSIEDAISMVRIQRYSSTNQPIGVFSPDGRRFAAVTWQGDLKNNTNIYRLVVLDPSKGAAPAGPDQAVLTWTFEGDPDDQYASPFHQLTFQPDNRTLAFLGRRDAGHAQVYSVDVESKQVRQLSKHPAPIRGFAIGAEGDLKLFSAIADADEAVERHARYEQDGVFLWDRSVLVPSRSFKALRVLDPEPRFIRQYFFARRPDDVELVFDSRQSRSAALPMSDVEIERGMSARLHDEETLGRWATLNTDPRGRRALLFPYARADHSMQTERYSHYKGKNTKLAAPYGVVDLQTGRITRLLDAPRPHVPVRSPVWSPDGRSVVVFTLLPVGVDERNAELPAQWVEVDVETGRTRPLNISSEWEVAAWAASGRELMLTRYKTTRFARIEKQADGSWSELRDLGELEQLNPIFKPATNGAFVVGVQENSYSPPELVSVDLRTRETRVLTQLNPQLLHRKYGEVTAFEWSHRYEPQASGFLIKPVDYDSSHRYPLVVLLDDSTLDATRAPYMLDAVGQLSGFAVQMLAAEGFAVLYTREPRSSVAKAAGVHECERMREHVESAVARLDISGVVDVNRVGLSGWSRAAYHTNCILTRTNFPFAAATQIDGGGREFQPSARPFTDEELLRIRTPLLLESHGLYSVVNLAAMADRLDAFGRPVELLHFPTGSHLLTRPGHRLRSLQSHMDWWRFWLLNREDPDPAKVAQFAHWRALREQWQRSGQQQLSRTPSQRGD